MAGGDERETDERETDERETDEQRQTWADERERRQQALRELAAKRVAEDASRATATLPQPAKITDTPRPATLRPPRTAQQGVRRHVVLAAIALAVLVVAAGAGAFYVRHQSSAAHVAQPVRELSARLSISPSTDGIAVCSSPGGGSSPAIAWSPDGQAIAVMGYASKCPNDDPISYAYQPGVVAIYSAATGALTGRFNPDAAISAALRLKPPQLPALTGVNAPPRGDTGHQIISYDGVLWSPDGTRLALFFQVDYFYNVQIQSDGSGQSSTTSWYGVATMSPSGGSPRVIAGPLPTYDEDHPTPLPWEYDLVQGRSLPPPTAPTNAYGAPQRQNGLAYAWNPDGTLAVQQPLAPNSVPKTPRLGPVGNPTHDASFTIWQPGHIGPDSQLGPGVYQYNWQFAAWSPDGRYIIPSLGTVGFGFGELLVPRKYGLTPQQLASDLNPAEVYLPMRDAALRTMLQQDIIGSVAWRPDGKRLAVIPEIRHGTNNQGADLAHMRVYDCASGDEIALLSMPLPAGDQSFQSALAWSPDGKQLMVFAQTGSATVVAPPTTTITFWRVS